jgi:hypothetical protein
VSIYLFNLKYGNVANSFPLNILFRYLFIEAFFGEESLFYRVFEGAFFYFLAVHLLFLWSLAAGVVFLS